MKIRAGLLIDFGNSETRVTLIANNNSKTFLLSNRFAVLPSGYVIPAEYKNDKSNILCVGSCYYANGHLADREFQGELIRPSALQKKSEQLVTEISLNLALITAVSELASGSGIIVSELEPTFDVSVLLPPMEHDTSVEAIRNLIKGVKVVHSFLPQQFDCAINIGDVKVFSEGVAAFFGVYYKEEDGELVEVPENSRYSEGYILILDIGAGTTDVVMIKDMELVLDSKDTFNLGGNMVEGELKKLIRKNYGFTPNDVSKVVATGELEDGASLVDVSDLVTKAKDSYSKRLLENIKTYLERMSMSMREVKSVLVIGGGSLPSVRDGVVVSPAMSDVLVNYLKELSPNISMMNIDGKNPRMLNIEGLQFIHKFS